MVDGAPVARTGYRACTPGSGRADCGTTELDTLHCCACVGTEGTSSGTMATRCALSSEGGVLGSKKLQP
eukprot:15339666-Alexandrium_andersonii.AAC.1